MKTPLLRFAAVAAVLMLPFCVSAQGTPPAGHPSSPPFAGGKSMTSEEALKQAPKDDPSLQPLDKAFSEAGAKLKKSPKDAKLKKAYVDTGYNYGHTVMMDRGKLRPTVQYRAALAIYRKVLVVDPKHKKTLEDKKLIEDIYKQMGLPIPK